MLLSHCDEIAVTTPYKHSKSQNILSLFVAPPFLTFFCALCHSMFSTFIFPIFISLCAWASNELVWFPWPARGTFFFPSPSPSSSHTPPKRGGGGAHMLACFLLSMLLLPQGLSRFFVSYPLHSFFFYIPMVLENPTHCTAMGCLQKFLMFGLCGPVLKV